MDYINKLSGNNNANTDNMNQNTQNQQQTSSGGSSGGFMDKLSGFTGGNQNSNAAQAGGQQSSGGGFMDKLNGMAGGGRESEKNEDAIDKGVDFVQEHVLGQGPQDNESAIEQAKDEQISDYIRGAYKNAAGSDVPIKDKETRFG